LTPICLHVGLGFGREWGGRGCGWRGQGAVAYTLCGWLTSGSLVPVVRRLEETLGKGV
jgi:hypothetical protein